jgi:hypothetical protein
MEDLLMMKTILPSLLNFRLLYEAIELLEFQVFPDHTFR